MTAEGEFLTEVAVGGKQKKPDQGAALGKMEQVAPPQIDRQEPPPHEESLPQISRAALDTVEYARKTGIFINLTDEEARAGAPGVKQCLNPHAEASAIVAEKGTWGRDIETAKRKPVIGSAETVIIPTLMQLLAVYGKNELRFASHEEYTDLIAKIKIISDFEAQLMAMELFAAKAFASSEYEETSATPIPDELFLVKVSQLKALLARYSFAEYKNLLDELKTLFAAKLSTSEENQDPGGITHKDILNLAEKLTLTNLSPADEVAADEVAADEASTEEATHEDASADEASAKEATGFYKHQQELVESLIHGIRNTGSIDIYLETADPNPTTAIGPQPELRFRIETDEKEDNFSVKGISFIYKVPAQDEASSVIALGHLNNGHQIEAKQEMVVIEFLEKQKDETAPDFNARVINTSETN